MRNPSNHKTITNLLAWRKLDMALDLPTYRVPREIYSSKPSVSTNGTKPIYNFEELHLLHAPSPLATRMNSRRVTVQLVKTTYWDYCQTTKVIKGHVFQLKCLQLFIMFDQDRLGDLSKFGFTQEETDINIAEAIGNSEY